MKKDMNKIGVLILIGIFILFYIITIFFLDKRNINKNTVENEKPVVKENNNYDSEKNIVNNLYKEAKMLYDVVNNKFQVSQDDTITIGDIVYKKIINFDEVTNNIFTSSGIEKYIEDLGNYFAYTDNGYYLAGNLVSYQTYYFRGDNTNIYIIDASETVIKAIIYEKWTSNNKNTLALINVARDNGKWLIDRIDILATE